MIATRLANVVVDRALAAREAMLEQALDHVGTDLTLFRDPTDQRLFQAQEAGFAPVLDWARTALKADLPLAKGLMPAPISSQAFAAIGKALWPLPEGDEAHRLALWRLTLVSATAPLLGSTLLALAIAAGRLSHADAFGLSRLEEEHQARLWGMDAEADARAAEIEREVMVYAAMLAALPR
jgi:chaperone required for assembly of F1-ATPase